MPILPNLSDATFEPGAPLDNTFFPLPRGTIQTYQGSKVDDESGEVETESNDFFATFESKEIEGVSTLVVRDTAYENGVLVEDTLDYFAQDTVGNVWYFGEIAYNYEYDDDGNYIETNTDGSWTAGVDGAVPGYLIRAEPGFGNGYYQEFAPGIAVDEAIVAGLQEEVTIGLGTFDGVLRTLESSTLEPDVAEFKNYAPGVGLVLVEEELDEEGEPELRVELQGVREVERDDVADDDEDDDDDDDDDDDEDDIALSDLVDKRGLDIGDHEDPEADDFVGDGSKFFVTFLSETAGFNSSIGAYTFDFDSGALGEGRILFTETEEARPGKVASIKVEAGDALGLFLVADGADLAVDLSAFKAGGLLFSNMLTRETATIEDGLGPLVTDDEGTPLPIQALHALGNDDGFNFLNPAAGVQAVELESELIDDDALGQISVIGFEDMRVTQAGYDGDFNDVIIAVSDTRLSAELVRGLLGELRGDAAAEGLFA